MAKKGGIAGISKGDCRIFLTDGAFREKEEVDELYKIWSASQAKVVSQPEPKPWKLHEFTVADLDGNLFRVFYDFSRDA